MNRDELSALALGAISVLAGVAILLAIVEFLGWWLVGLIGALAVADYIRCTIALRGTWRPW